MKFLDRLWREPLLHFLLIGAVLFAFYGLTREGESEAPNRIVVSSGQVEQLIANFRRTWMRPPTQDELNGVIDNHVRDEVFYREALAMGLDQNDPLVRRRMRMKLEFILEELITESVSDESLQAFMQKHPDKYRVQPKVSFTQVYLNPDQRDDLSAAADELLARLRDGAAPESMGDPTMVPHAMTLATEGEISRVYGDRFAEDVLAHSPGDWIGPVQSPFGAHLLKITERIAGRLPGLAQVRAAVERDYLAQRRAEQKDLAYERLREGYEVIIEPLPTARAPAGDAMAASRADEAAQ